MTQPQESAPTEIVAGGGGGGGGGTAIIPTTGNGAVTATFGTPPPEAPPADGTPGEVAPVSKSPEDYEAMIRELRKENAGWRTKMREAEPILKAHNAAEEAAKTEVQKATERATAAETDRAHLIREVVAIKYGVPEEDYDFLGSGTREEMEAKAARYAARFASAAPPPPPPSDRPVEGLRPGASPTPPPPADHSYPAAWKP